MDVKTVAAAIALAAVTSGCQFSASTLVNQHATLPTVDRIGSATQPKSTSAPVDIESTLESLSYLEARALLLEEGWSPVVSKTCNEDVVGSYELQCVAKKISSWCHLCAELPELQTCTSNGLCAMQFSLPGTAKKISIATYGDIETWRASPEKTDLMIQGAKLTEGN
ncbi:hypothetical protein [Lysobacter antibioticus]|uniref:hypothetical protein n=1 Tax=Lysobacter antibioticus TaxID=84531 RepID=UPI0011874992|nr:hypothetical protein [Lysobacter antibioticus]